MSLHVIIGAGPVGSATALRLAAAVLAAVERSGAVLVSMSNLYGYGPVSHPLTERAWGHPWHVPTGAPVSQRGIFTDLARIAGAPAPRLRPVPPWLLRAAGLAVPTLRELGEVAYQFTGPFVMDSSAFQDTFGAGPTPADQALAATVTWCQPNGRTAASKE